MRDNCATRTGRPWKRAVKVRWCCRETLGGRLTLVLWCNRQLQEQRWVAAAGALLLQYAGNYDAFWPVMVAVGIAATAMNWTIRPPRAAPA